MTGVAYIALARSTARRGGLAEAEHLLDQALQVLGNDSYRVQNAQATVELAGVRHARGDLDGARAAIDEARRLITTFADPGMLGSLLEGTSARWAVRAAAGDPRLPTRSPAGSWSSCGCWQPSCRSRRSPRSSTCPSTRSGPTPRGSTASWGWPPGRRPSPSPASTGSCDPQDRSSWSWRARLAASWSGLSSAWLASAGSDQARMRVPDRRQPSCRKEWREGADGTGWIIPGQLHQRERAGRGGDQGHRSVDAAVEQLEQPGPLDHATRHRGATSLLASSGVPAASSEWRCAATFIEAAPMPAASRRCGIGDAAHLLAGPHPLASWRPARPGSPVDG
jgi:hypothetical protein